MKVAHEIFLSFQVINFMFLYVPQRWHKALKRTPLKPESTAIIGQTENGVLATTPPR